MRDRKISLVCRLMAILFLLVCFALLAACSDVQEIMEESYVRVILLDSDDYDAEQQVYDVKKYGDAEISLTLANSFAFSECSYSGEYYVDTELGDITLTLKNVRYDTRISVSVFSVSGTVRYYLNGGQLKDDAEITLESSATGEYYTSYVDLSHHLRYNTDTALEIERPGYTQLGWNTAADGSGEHTGLGSRVTVEEDSALFLYAEWAEWTDAEYFTWTEYTDTEDDEDDIELSSYNGPTTLDMLVIPAEIDGHSVTSLGKKFAQSLKIQTLVLPNTMIDVNVRAFSDTTIEEIYFFDNLEIIYDSSIGYQVSTIHINAYLAPRYSSGNDNAQFAEDMDRMILNADKKKMVFFAGCSMSYGLDSSLVDEEYGNEYVVMNMGVIGGTNALFQFECMTPYMGEGDIFIHAPEEMSSYQLMADTEAESRMFVTIESNYDLLTLVDCSQISGIFTIFTRYNTSRSVKDALTYLDYNENYNEYGDYSVARADSSYNACYDLEVCFYTDLVTETSVGMLNTLYDAMQAKGVTVFFSYAPINRNALSSTENSTHSWEVFDALMQLYLDSDVKIISDVTDYIMTGNYFYDTDYHLSTNGAKIRTENLLTDIKNALA